MSQTRRERKKGELCNQLCSQMPRDALTRLQSPAARDTPEPKHNSTVQPAVRTHLLFRQGCPSPAFRSSSNLAAQIQPCSQLFLSDPRRSSDHRDPRLVSNWQERSEAHRRFRVSTPRTSWARPTSERTSCRLLRVMPGRSLFRRGSAAMFYRFIAVCVQIRMRKRVRSFFA